MTAQHERRSYLAIAVLLLAVTTGHYLTGSRHALHHEVLRRLYYLPVVWGALVGGLRGGLLTSAAAVLLYLPHAFLLPMNLDPSGAIDKGAELIMYVMVGALAGALIDRQRVADAAAARAAVDRSRAEERARRADTVARLARGLAHELRNPLGGIQGALEILADAVPPGHPGLDMAEIGVSEVERLDRVITNFMQFARPTPADPAPFDLGKVARDVATLLATDAEAAGLALGAEPVGAEVAAVADGDHVVQILINLVRNAIQATPPGGSVAVVAAQRGDRAVAEVLDTGPGVPEELGQSIYDPYVTGRDDGTGLGLAIAATLASGSGGTLAHRPRRGGGTVFTLDLPGASRP